MRAWLVHDDRDPIHMLHAHRTNDRAYLTHGVFDKPSAVNDGSPPLDRILQDHRIEYESGSSPSLNLHAWGKHLTAM